jgi:hypothetical protein
MSIKITANLPHGEVYLPYLIEVSLEALRTTESGRERQQEIIDFIASTVAAIHKATSGSPTDGSEEGVGSISATGDTATESNSRKSGPTQEIDDRFTITLIDRSSGWYEIYRGGRHEQILNTLRAFVDRRGDPRYQYWLLHDGRFVNQGETAHSVSFRFNGYKMAHTELQAARSQRKHDL